MILNGKSYLPYDLHTLPADFVLPSRNEVFTLMWATKVPNGLMWIQDNSNIKMYLALKVSFYTYKVIEISLSEFLYNKSC